MNKRTQIMLLGVVAIAALFAAIYFFIFIPYQDQIEEIQEEVITQDDTNINLIVKNQRLTRMIQLIPAAEEYDAGLMTQFPVTSEADTLRASIVSVAAKNSISEITVSLDVPSLIQEEQAPAAPQPDAPAEEDEEEEEAEAPEQPAADTPAAMPTIAHQGISITGKGTDADVAKFLKGLEDSDRSIIVTAFTASGSDDNVTSFTISASSYLHASVSTPMDVEAEEEAEAEEQALIGEEGNTSPESDIVSEEATLEEG